MSTEEHVTYSARLEDSEGRTLATFRGLYESEAEAEAAARGMAHYNPSATTVVVTTTRSTSREVPL